MAKRQHNGSGDRLKTDRKSGHREDRFVETPLDPSQSRDSDVTGDPLDELDVAGREMYERVRVGLGLGPGPQHRQLGRFVLERCLGVGGMGVVHLAKDPQLGREVAIKRIAPRPYVSSKLLRNRLEREGRALAKLRHPNVIHIYELGEHEGEVFLAMEYVAGKTLNEWQREPGRTQAEVLRAYIEAGKGLAAAHAAQVVHRDFKPENVLVAEDGRVQVGDFGLAALLRELELPEPEVRGPASPSEAARITKTGELVGTLPYMPPERLRGEPGEALADQFSFCVALWEALTGELPFAGDEQDPLRERILAGELREGSELPRWLRLALMRGLSMRPEQRHSNMDQLVFSLERGLGRSKRWLLGGLFFIAGVTAVLGVGFGLVNRSTRPPCDLEEAVAAAEQADWEPLRKELGADAARLRPLEHHLNLLATRADRICQAGNAARIDQAVAWLEDLGGLLADPGSRSRERLLNYVDWLADRRLHGPPPRPLDAKVVQALHASEARELANDLDGALRSADEALQLSQWEFEKADALLRRGRVLSLRSEYPKAFADFYAAQRAADRSKYEDARLRANLLTAELMLKRFDEVGLAPYFLDEAETVADRIDEPTLSPRRASHDELQAIVERQREHLDRAFLLQLRALLRRSLVGDPPYLIARSLAGLGILAEARGEPNLAERCYRTALAMLPEPSPERYQVACLLGRWLAQRVLQEGELDPEEARALLREAIEGRFDLRFAATSNLLLLELFLDEHSPAIAPLREQLALQLREETGNRVYRSEAWQTLGLAFAAAGDFAQLDEAAREVYALARLDDALTLARFELSVAGFVEDLEIRRRYATLARSRLEPMPASAEREFMLEAATELLSDAP